ncbi:MAG: glycosyl hydrolase family 18 protein [Snowella sp.]|nr:glycosyl hydrolase family 18 protein [Snowella sp.]
MTNTVNFSVLSNWGTGFQGEITLTNGGDLLVSNWTLEFTSSFAITSIWNAEIVSRVGDRYVIRYANWQPNLEPGQSVTIGFIGTPVNGTVPPPTNYLLNGVAVSSGGSTPVLPSITLNDASIVEGNSGIRYLVYTVSLSAASTQTVTVNYGTSNGTAKAGEDYTALTGTLTFAPGETSKTLQIAIQGDTLVEANETLYLNLSNAVGAAIAKTQAIGTITNDDQAPAPTNGNIAVAFKVDSQWSSGFTGTITITNQGTTAINNWKLAFDSLFSITSLWNAQQLPGANGRYEVTNLSWNAQIPVNGSVSFGFNGTFTGSQVPAPTNYQFNGQLLSSLPSLSVNDVQLTEGNTGSFNAVFTVSLNAASSNPVTVSYTTADGTAKSLSDYTAIAGTLTFNPGETVKTVTVAVKGDTLYEGNENFFLNLSNPTQAIITDGQGIATIVDNDPAPLNLRINDVTITEGNAGLTNAVFTVSLSAVSSNIITVNYATQNGTAIAGSDYVSKTGTLTFSPGQLSQTITVSINGDTSFESNETFNVNLSNPTNAIINDALGVATISNDDPNPQKYVVAAYYPEWAIYDRNFQVKDIPANNLTHIFYAFAKIDNNGEVAIFDPWAATQITFNGKYTWDQSTANQAGNFAELRALKTENPHLTNMLSIGGWTLSSPFSDVALTDTSRKKFATSAVNFIVKYGFDGIDLDWEYPVGGGLDGNVNRPEDKQNYTLLVAELRQQLNLQQAKDGKTYQLTIASPAGFDKIANFDLGQMAPYLDFFNVMTYDYHGAWEKTTNHQAALYSNPNDPSTYKAQYNIASTIQQYKNAGVKAEDLVLGVPLYGRSWTGVPNINDGLFQSATGAGPGTWEAGNFDYKDLHQKINTANSGYVRYWDDVAKVPYIYNKSLGVFSTYEDKQSLGAKMDYLKTQGLGGMFFWEASGDLVSTHPDSLISLAANQLGVTV